MAEATGWEILRQIFRDNGLPELADILLNLLKMRVLKQQVLLPKNFERLILTSKDLRAT